MSDTTASPQENAQSGENGTENQPAATEKTLTQSEVDRIVSDRLARERAKYADYEDLKKKVDAQKSEAEKAIEAARAEGGKEVLGKVKDRLFEAEVRSHASALKFRDAGDALSVFGARDGLVSDDGTVDTDEVQRRLSKIAEEKPYLVDTPSQVAQRPTLKSKGNTKTTDQTKPKKAAEALRAFATGR